jgi:hypothetical protein
MPELLPVLFFRVAAAETEAEIQPDSMADTLTRET